jgi:hypothetical protein
VQVEGLGRTFLTNVVSYFIILELNKHPPSEFVEKYLLSFEGLHYSPEFSPFDSEAVNSSIPSPHPSFNFWEGSIS